MKSKGYKKSLLTKEGGKKREYQFYSVVFRSFRVDWLLSDIEVFSNLDL
jgi:hypothetical protein